MLKPYSSNSVTALVLIGSFLSVAGCSQSYSSGPVPVTYQVSGFTTRAEVHYINETGGTDTLTVVGPEKKTKKREPWERDLDFLSLQPWEKTVTIPVGGTAYLSAQIPDEYAGQNIKVAIIANGTIIKSSESNGKYATASVAARN
jgi:hypothetical protein